MTFSDDFTIGSMEELIEVIDELGFVLRQGILPDAEQGEIERILK